MTRQCSTGSFVRRNFWVLVAAFCVPSLSAHAAESVNTPTVPAIGAAPVQSQKGTQAERTGTSEVKRDDVVDSVRTRSTDALPEDPVAQKVRGRFAERFGDMPIKAVTRTPFGLFEVLVGSDLIYTDEEVRWVMQGPLVNAKTREDLSAKRLEALSAIEFDTLPLELALKTVKGNGVRKVATFEDPNCGYCKKLATSFQSMDNVTIYTFLLPILSQDSEAKSHNIWCADNPTQAWDNWMLHNKVPVKATKAGCVAPISAVRELAGKFMIRGAPVIYFEDGTRVVGFLPPDALNQRLQQH